MSNATDPISPRSVKIKKTIHPDKVVMETLTELRKGIDELLEFSELTGCDTDSIRQSIKDIADKTRTKN